MLQCYSNNPYPSQNHPKALMSFLRLLWYEKYSCSAHCKNGGEIKQFHLKQSQRIIVFCKLGNFFHQTNNLLSQRWDSLRVTISLKQTHHSFFFSLQSKVKWLKRIQGAGCFLQEASDFVSVALKQYCKKCSDVLPKGNWLWNILNWINYLWPA